MSPHFLFTSNCMNYKIFLTKVFHTWGTNVLAFTEISFEPITVTDGIFRSKLGPSLELFRCICQNIKEKNLPQLGPNCVDFLLAFQNIGSKEAQGNLSEADQVLFNQASTGYVSGISYSYKGLVMQGSKLGNAFKWSTIKNIINYEQETVQQEMLRKPANFSRTVRPDLNIKLLTGQKDRQRIHACLSVALRRRETNIRSEHALDQLRAGNKHAQRNPANTQGSAVKYGKLPDSAQTNRLYIFSPSFGAGINKHANQSFESQPERVVNVVPKIQRGISLASLLDSNNRGRDLGPTNQSPADDGVKKKRKQKKRRGLRL
jgi:hypothetical protein